MNMSFTVSVVGGKRALGEARNPACSISAIEPPRNEDPRPEVTVRLG
jgi:hypothetical protein